MSQGNAMPERPLAGSGRSNLRTYFGGCDCGAVRYQVELELRARDPRTQSVWEHSVSPQRFQLQTGHDSLIGYQFAAESAHHFFCMRCQARAFSHVAPELGAGYYTFDLKALYARELYAPPASVSVRGV
jgi:hypothetical protein